MRETFKKKTRNEWVREFEEVDVCFSPVQSLDEVIKDKHFVERNMIMKVTKKNSEEVPLIGFPIKLSRTPGSYYREPDSFGESTYSILKELGYSEEEIGHLAQKGVI
jgi:formyl-CoA transferase/CoA:oxalate CoA-transferase